MALGTRWAVVARELSRGRRCSSSPRTSTRVLSLADRIAVMFERAIIGWADPRTSTREEIGRLMAGVR